MKFRTLNNREVRMDILPERYPMRSREQSKSEGQFLLGRVIRSIYGLQAMILEEFPIPEERLFLDFYMPHHNLAFEYQGQHHDKFNKFFHGDKSGFDRSQKRDERKRQWCVLNSVVLVEVRDSLTAEQLQALIQETRANG
jgi:hypothetical protein